MTIYVCDQSEPAQPTDHHQVRQCTDDTCRLRFPARAAEVRAQRCPRCGAPTSIAAEIEQRRETTGAAQAGATVAQVPHPLVVVVDNVRSLFNVGSIFRSADGAGIHHLHLCGITATPANPKLTKTALGAEHAVSWTHHRNSLDCAQQLRAAGYLLWALEEHAAATSIFTVPLPMLPVALVIGNEVTGVDPALLACCTTVVALPMQGVKRSLNVATAFGAAAIILAHRVATAQGHVREQASRTAERPQPAGVPSNQRATMPSTLPSTLLRKSL